jgi:glycosyltransferase involved in cell wall biosynthesis
MNFTPLVSINLCCYNSKRYLKETLDSIINQSYENWELVIVNDGSTDETELIVKEYIERGFPVKYLYQENRGLGYSRNKAIELSRGEYVALIDHDDLWFPSKLQQQVDFLNKNPGTILCYTDGYFLHEGTKSEIKFSSVSRFYRGNVFPNLVEHDFIGLPSVLINRSMAGDALFFNPRYRFSEEYELFLRLSLQSKIDFIDEPLVYYRIHASNFSNNVNVQIEENEEIYRSFADQIQDLGISLHRIRSRLYRGVVVNLVRQDDPKQAMRYRNHLIRYFSLKNLLTYLLLQSGLHRLLSANTVNEFRRLKDNLVSLRYIRGPRRK